MNRLLHDRTRSASRLIWTLVLGLLLGGLFTRVSEAFLPNSAARDFLTTSVAASIGPLDLDLVAVGITLGPLVVTLNALTLIGIGIVALIARTWI